jgi:hypothetical protein
MAGRPLNHDENVEGEAERKGDEGRRHDAADQELRARPRIAVIHNPMVDRRRNE